MTNSLLAITLTSCCLQGASAGMDTTTGINCQAAPRGADQVMIDCYDDACNEYKDDLKACDPGDTACEATAFALYQINLQICDVSMPAAPLVRLVLEASPDRDRLWLITELESFL